MARKKASQPGTTVRVGRKKPRREFVVAFDAAATSDYGDRDLMAYIREALVVTAKGGDPEEQLFDLKDSHITVKKSPLKED